jgi:hypothetical protein
MKNFVLFQCAQRLPDAALEPATLTLAKRPEIRTMPLTSGFATQCCQHAASSEPCSPRCIGKILASAYLGPRPSRRDAAWYRCYFPFRFSVVASSLDADQQLLVEDAKDPLQHRNRGDVVARFELRDERVRRSSAFGYVLLGELELVASFSDVRRDPVSLSELADGGVLGPGCRYSSLRRARARAAVVAGAPFGLLRVSVASPRP